MPQRAGISILPLLAIDVSLNSLLIDSPVDANYRKKELENRRRGNVGGEARKVNVRPTLDLLSYFFLDVKRFPPVSLKKRPLQGQTIRQDIRRALCTSAYNGVTKKGSNQLPCIVFVYFDLRGEGGSLTWMILYRILFYLGSLKLLYQSSLLFDNESAGRTDPLQDFAFTVLALQTGLIMLLLTRNDLVFIALGEVSLGIFADLLQSAGILLKCKLASRAYQASAVSFKIVIDMFFVAGLEGTEDLDRPAACSRNADHHLYWHRDGKQMRGHHPAASGPENCQPIRHIGHRTAD